MKKILVISASSRDDGNTFEAIEKALDGVDYDLIDLKQKNIGYFDYNHANKDDDFVKVIDEMLLADKIIFASPIYWYSVSAIMKTFFDRFSDLVTIRQEKGRALAGKECYIVTTAGGMEEIPQSFSQIIVNTCEYMNMIYKESLFYYKGENTELVDSNKDRIKIFREKLIS